ncbi:MAG: hypothetical protein HQ521_06445 [Bacteroidetes bacterium]|nr:hypothetical protein [Bacteroidota bacterium]
MKTLYHLLKATSLVTLMFISVIIIGQNPFTVELIQPNSSGIEWVVGETYTVSWTDNLTQPVEVWLWNPNAGPAAYEELTPSGGVTGTTWPWTISNSLLEASDYHIKVQSTTSPGTYYDMCRF